MHTAEQIRTDMEPFYHKLEEFDVNSSLTSFTQLPNDERYIIRAEPMADLSHEDVVRSQNALAEFESMSGLKVVPHWDVIGSATKTRLHKEREHHLDPNDHFNAVFHVTGRVVGIDACEQGLGNQAIEPSDINTLLTGILSYYIGAYDNKKPHIYEIRTDQFVFGTIPSDSSPAFYMVDVDNALSSQTTVDDVLGSTWDVLTYMQSYGVKEDLRSVADKMLEFYDRDDVKQVVKKQQWDGMRIELLDYVDSIDHL